jgi:hypothetical protein
MKYRASKDIQITGSNSKGDAIGPIKFDKGYYETKKRDEIELLDSLATDPNHPVGFDPKDKEE